MVSDPASSRHDRSAARGEMSIRGLYVFEHASEPGDAYADALFDIVQVQKKVEVPRAFADYGVAVHEAGIPQSVKLHSRVG